MNFVKISAIFLGLILLSGTISSQSFADVVSPRQQMKLDFTAEQIICSEHLVKVIKKTTGEASCVKPSSAEKLAEHGWAKPLSEEKLEEIKMKKNKKGQSAGTITKIAAVKQLSKAIKAGTPVGVSGYSYIFEACGNTKLIRAPEIFITSDSETKKIKLGSPLKPGECYTSSALIKAADPTTISATLLNRGGISDKISSLETQIADLKSKITEAKKNLPTTNEKSPSSENLTNITDMKKELKGLQDQLRRYLMALYVPPNVKASSIDIPKSITGKPLDGMSTSLISVTESVLQPENPDLKRFNVVFEACTGQLPVRLPIITVESDYESIEVKLVERIVPETCQVGITRINAMDSESISPKISGNSGVSEQIDALEMRINELQTILADKRSQLAELVSKKLDATTEPLVAQLAVEISEIRTDLLQKRVQVNGLLLSVS